MARKQVQHPENYDKVFPARLRELMKGKTQQDLAVYLGKTRQAISYYLDGSSSPDWETLAKIASFLGVSSDYLIGLTQDPNRAPSAVDTLGLSNENVCFLTDPGTTIGRPSTTPAFKSLINTIINDLLDAFRTEKLYNDFQLMQKIIKRIKGMNHLDEPYELPPVSNHSGNSDYMPTLYEVERFIEHRGYFVLPAESGAEFYAEEIGKKISKHLVNKYLIPYLNNYDVVEASIYGDD